MDRETGWCVDAVSPLASPSLAIYSPYHHTYSMCISTVHYCCHRNVMHSVSYRLTQLNGIPCLICSGSFILILYWKGIVNTVWRSGEKRRGKERRKEQERKKEAGSSLLLFSPPLFPSFLSLSLSFFSSNVCSVHWQSNRWLSYTHIHYITHTWLYLLSFCDPPCACVADRFGRRAGGAFKGTEIVGIHYVVTKKKFYLRWYRHWSRLRSGVFMNHRMNCIAFIPYRSHLLTRWFRSPITYILV